VVLDHYRGAVGSGMPDGQRQAKTGVVNWSDDRARASGLSRPPHPITVLVIRDVEWLIEYRFAAIAPTNTVCRVACPVPLVHGRDDESVPVDDARRIADRCHAPQVRLLEIPDAGQHDSTDQIQRYDGQLLRFLETIWAARV